MIPGGSNDESLTDIDTHNYYICKVAQYLASPEALLCAFTYALPFHKYFTSNTSVFPEAATMCVIVFP